VSPDTFKSIRNHLGLSQRGTANLLRMAKHGVRNVQRWEEIDPKTGKPKQDIPGWAAFIMEMLYSRKWPDLTPFKRKRL
jgi:hypothetical protein